MTVSASSHMKVLIGLYWRPVSCANSAITSRARRGTSLTKWVRWSTEPAWKSGWFCTPPVRPGLCTSTSAGTRWRVPFSWALIHCRRHWPCSSSGIHASCALDQRAFVVVFDGVGRFGEEGLELERIARREVVPRAARDIAAAGTDATLVAEQHFLRHRRTLDPAGRIAEELAQELRLRHHGFGHHVAGGEAVHGVGDRDQRQGAELVGDRREIGGFLRVAAEQDRVAGLAAARRRRRDPPSR